MLNYTTGLQSAKSRLWENLQDTQPSFFNKHTAREKEKLEGGICRLKGR